MWTHVCAVKEGTNDADVKLYVNGQLDVGTVGTNAVPTMGGSDNYWLGCTSYGNDSVRQFEGYMSDVRIYKDFVKYRKNFIPASSLPMVVPDSPSSVAYASEFEELSSGSVQFSGGNDDYLSWAPGADVAFGTGDFTVEGWWYYRGAPDQHDYLIDCRNSGQTTGTWSLSHEYATESPSGTLQFSSGSAYLMQSSKNPTVNQWNHIAVTRSGNALKMFINGEQTASATDTTNFSTEPTISYIGTRHSTEHSFDGWMSNIRIVKGTAVYTQNFSVPIKPLTAISGTTLLCAQSGPEPAVCSTTTSPLNLPLSSTPFSDTSGNSVTITNNGSVTTASAGDNQFNITTAADFGGTGGTDSLTATLAAPTYLTVDCWFKGTSGRPFDWGTDGMMPAANVVNSGVYEIYVSSPSAGWEVIQSTDSNWQHLRITSSAYYFDGKKGPSVPRMPDNSSLKIGRRQSNDADGWNGLVGPFVVYNADLGAPPPNGGLAVTSGAATNTPKSLGRINYTELSEWNPFDKDINTVMGQETGYCTLNPLDSNSAANISEGNLKVGHASNGYYGAALSIKPTTGKWYFESTLSSYDASGTRFLIGFVDDDASSKFIPNTAGNWMLNSYMSGIQRSYNGSYSSVTGMPALADGDVEQLAIDYDAQKCWVGKNNVWVDASNTVTGNPAAGTNATFTSSDFPTNMSLFVTGYYGFANLNCGQKPFKFPPPEGFLPLNLANLPRPLPRPDQYVKPVVYTGNDSGDNSGTGITWGIPVDVGFGPDLIWLKSRTQTYGWYIYDTIRGGDKDGGTAVPGVDKECYDYMLMQATNAEVNAGTNGDSTLNGIGVNQKGFNVDIGGQAVGEAAQGTHNMVAWCWKAGGWKGTWNLNGEDAGSAAAAGLTTGDTSVLNAASINTKAGFSIVKWTQDSGGAAKNIAHGLTQAPNFVIMKHINSTSNWYVTHTSLSSGAKILYMNTDDDEDTSSDFGNAFPGATYTATSTTGVNGRQVMMYSWHNISGLQKFGSYAANNSADGPFINLGFRPAIVMVKVYSGGTNNWVIWDRARMEATGNNSSTQGVGNPNGNTLQPDDTTEEPTSGLYYVDFLSNGFKLRVGGSGALRVNGSSNSYKYVYCAWAEAPSFNLYGGQSNAS